MKKLIVLILSCFLPVFLIAEDILDEKLPADETVLTGTLENGFSYYIKDNKKEEKKAVLRLVVKVGSVLEEENQKGLAHYVEHMVFRGSENFPEWAVIEYMQSIGASFGKHTNAYTSYENTTYVMEVPLINDEVLDKSLHILSDFAFRSDMSEEGVQKEKGIILDEMNRTTNANTKTMIDQLNRIFEGTDYEDKCPIGKKNVVENATSKDLLGFYKKWYCPHLMGVVVVGDVDQEKVKESIEKHFNVPSAEEKIYPNYNIDPNKQLIAINSEEDLTDQAIILFKLNKKKSEHSYRSLGKEIIYLLADSVLARRLDELSRQNNSPIKMALPLSGSFMGKTNLEAIYLQAWDEMGYDAIEAIVKEVRRCSKYGLSERELKLAKEEILDQLKGMKANLQEQNNAMLAGMYMASFYDESYPVAQKEILDFQEGFINELSLESINNILAEYEDFITSWSALISYPENAKQMQEEKVKNIITSDYEILPREESETSYDDFEIFNDEKTDYVSSVEDESIKELILNNGIKVVLKPTKNKSDDIWIFAVRDQGLAHIDQDIYDSARIANKCYLESGIGNIPSIELDKLLSGTGIGSYGSIIHNATATIFVETKNVSLNLATRLIRLFFSPKTIDNSAFERVKRSCQEELKYNNSPDEKFMKFVSSINTQNHKFFKDIDVDKISLDKVTNILSNFYDNPKNFTLFVVGDFDENNLISLLNLHIGSYEDEIESNNFFANTVPLLEFPKGKIKETLYQGIETGSRSVISFPVKCERKTISDDLKRKLFYKMINKRLLEDLRKKIGMVYGVMAFEDMPFPTDTSYSLMKVFFTSSVENNEEVVSIILDELNNIKENGFEEEEFVVCKKMLNNELNDMLQNNIQTAAVLLDLDFFGKLDDLDKLSQHVDLVTLNEINDFSENQLLMEDCTILTRMPKK